MVNFPLPTIYYETVVHFPKFFYGFPFGDVLEYMLFLFELKIYHIFV